MLKNHVIRTQSNSVVYTSKFDLIQSNYGICLGSTEFAKSLC